MLQSSSELKFEPERDQSSVQHSMVVQNRTTSPVLRSGKAQTLRITLNLVRTELFTRKGHVCDGLDIRVVESCWRLLDMRTLVDRHRVGV
jgi:hypothetical protein